MASTKPTTKQQTPQGEAAASSGPPFNGVRSPADREMLERATHHIRLRGSTALNGIGSDALALEPPAADTTHRDDQDADEMRGAA